MALETIPIKKTLSTTGYPTHFYLTVAGTNLQFSISVITCPTTNCTTERLTAAGISSKNYNVREDADPEADNVVNLSIFAAVGVGLVGLGLGTYVIINTLRQFKESIEEPLVD